MLGGVFTSIGLFTSSLGKNQIIAFTLSVFLCFLSFSAFDSISKLIVFQNFENSITGLGINQHYQSISRVVLASRDFIYFGSLYYTLLRINITNGGSGYTIAPDVLISSPSVSWGIDAQEVANITNQSVTSIDIVSSGRGFTSAPIITIGAPQSGIDTATASAEMFPSYSIIESATPISPSGICTITTKEVVPFSVGIGTTIPFFKQSRVLASGHSFEYIGSGVTISTALPSVGGVAIEDNQVDMRNGGLVIYTSTDQSGNFKIGDGVKIDQSTGQITGNDYSRSVISIVTPYILSLGGE
jgi:hypothetical protein